MWVASVLEEAWLLVEDKRFCLVLWWWWWWWCLLEVDDREAGGGGGDFMEEDGGVQTGGGDVDDELSTPEKQRHDITGDITEDVKLSHITLGQIQLLTFLFPRWQWGLSGQETRDVIGGGAICRTVITAVRVWPMRGRGRSFICRKKQAVPGELSVGERADCFTLTFDSQEVFTLVQPGVSPYWSCCKPLQSAVSLTRICSCL